MKSGISILLLLVATAAAVAAAIAANTPASARLGYISLACLAGAELVDRLPI